MEARGNPDARSRRRMGGRALVAAALVAVPGVAYAQAELTGDGTGDAAPVVRVAHPAPWQTFRAGAAVDVVAAVTGSRDGTCHVR